MYKQKVLAPNVHVELIGGDLTVLDETDKIVEFCIEHGASEMAFHSSCIYYSKAIERALKEVQETTLDFSIDCGNRELYKKIKLIDAFDNVVANLKRYIKCRENAQDCLIAKYVIVDGYNDSVEALEEWLQLINSLGIKKVKMDINFRRFFPEYKHPDPTVPKHYYKMWEHFKKRVKDFSMEDKCWEYTIKVFETGRIPDEYY